MLCEDVLQYFQTSLCTLCREPARSVDGGIHNQPAARDRQPSLPLRSEHGGWRASSWSPIVLIGQCAVLRHESSDALQAFPGGLHSQVRQSFACADVESKRQSGFEMSHDALLGSHGVDQCQVGAQVRIGAAVLPAGRLSQAMSLDETACSLQL